MFGEDQTTFERFVAGQIAGMRELTMLLRPAGELLQALCRGLVRPDGRGAWGKDNRTCSLRSVGHGRSLRIENRLPGADVNPYLALSAMIASGLHGIDNELELEPPLEGNAYESDAPHVPSTLYAARDAFAESALARDAFGQEVVDHYLNHARVELEAFESAVTDWEKFRGFERL